MKFYLIVVFLAAWLAHAENQMCGVSMFSYLTYLTYPGSLEFDLDSDDSHQMTKQACQSFVEKLGGKLHVDDGVRGIFNLDNRSYIYVIYAMTWPPPLKTVDYTFSYDICFDGFRKLMQICPSQGGVIHRAAYSYELIPIIVSYHLHNILVHLS